MGGASGIGNRDNGAKGEPAIGIAHGMAEALETGVPLVAPPVTGMQVDAVGIVLPNLDPCTGEGACVAVQHAARQVQDVAAGLAPRTRRLRISGRSGQAGR